MDLLLKQLLIDENNNDKSLYSSGDYWVKKNIKTIYHLKNKNLENFRGMNSGVGTSFADNIVINIENEINLLGRLIFNFFKLPFLKHLHKKQVEITKSHAKDHLRSLSILYKNSSKVKELIKKYKFENTVNYGCCQKFSIGGIEYSNLYLEIANRIDNISKFQDFKSFNSFFEIGGGFGANIHFLVTNFPNIKKILYLDTVPNIYIGTEYLRKHFKNKVKEYISLKNLDKIEFSNNDDLEILCIPPWEIEKVNVEDEGFVSLPINAQLIDRNENISEIVITGSKGEISQVVFMAPKGYEGLSLDGYLNQVDDVFAIDTAGWAANALSVHSNLTDEKSAQELLAGNLGVQTGLNVSGNISVNVSYTTATAIDTSITNISNQDLILEIKPMPENKFQRIHFSSHRLRAYAELLMCPFHECVAFR